MLGGPRGRWRGRVGLMHRRCGVEELGCTAGVYRGGGQACTWGTWKGFWATPRGPRGLPGGRTAGVPGGPDPPPPAVLLPVPARPPRVRSVPGLQRVTAGSLCQCPVIKMSPFNFQASRSNLFLIKSLIETLLPPPPREGPRKRL